MALLECGELCHALCVHLRCLSKTEGWTVGYGSRIAFEKSLGDNFLLPVLPSFDNQCDYSIFICRQ